MDEYDEAKFLITISNHFHVDEYEIYNVWGPSY